MSVMLRPHVNEMKAKWR